MMSFSFDDTLLQSGQGVEDFVGGGRWVFALNGLVVERPQGIIDEGIPLVATQAGDKVILVEGRAAGQRQNLAGVRIQGDDRPGLILQELPRPAAAAGGRW